MVTFHQVGFAANVSRMCWLAVRASSKMQCEDIVVRFVNSLSNAGLNGQSYDIFCFLKRQAMVMDRCQG